VARVVLSRSTRERKEVAMIAMRRKHESKRNLTLAHKAARPLRYFKDKDGYGWLCDKDVDPKKDLREQGCWRCDEMAFPTGGR
jgi:hypothetical protein